MNPLDNARIDRSALLQQREALDRKISALDDAIKILETVYRPLSDNRLATLTSGLTAGDIADLGLTSAVERVLMELPNLPFPPVRVRDTLVSRGFQLSGDNPMSSIHQVLRRLVARPNSPFLAIEVDGQTMYIYNPNRAEAARLSELKMHAAAEKISLLSGAKPITAVETLFGKGSLTHLTKDSKK